MLPYVSAVAALLLATACQTAAPTPAPTPTVSAQDDIAPPPPPAGWLALLGEYGPDSAVTIVLERGNQLWLHSASGETRLVPVSDSVFTAANAPRRRVVFQRAPTGRVARLLVGEAPLARRQVGPESGNQLVITPVRPMDELRREALAAQPPVERGPFLPSDLVELTTLDSTIKLEIRYATSNNLFSTPFYSQPRAFLQRPAAEALVRVNAALRPRGYGLLVHDGYRPWSVTKMFWDATPDDKRIFVADPAVGSKHNRGAAVDLTLYDLATGAPVEMVATYDETSPRASPSYPGGTSRQRWHRELLRRAMEAERFAVFAEEWWHYDYADWQKYPIGAADFERLAGAQSRATSGIDERVVDSIVTAGMRQQRLVGLSIALVRGGRIELAKGYGASSLEPSVPVDTGTRFSIGSVTKQFVAALALLLQEDGKLSVHDTLSKWYPRLTRSREITLLDLIHHVSGYRDYYPLDYVNREMSKPTTAEHIMQKYGTLPLDFNPGTRWSYSNTGYTILGRVLERVGGKPLETLLDERIFRPLGMLQTMYEPTQPERRASGFVSWALGEMEPALLEGQGWIGAAGGIWSTASDIARWDVALMRPGFLTPASRGVLFGERILRDSIPTGYAGGLGVAQSQGRTVFQHGGATSGFSATNVFIPGDSAAVVLLSNTDQNIAAAPFSRMVSPPRSTAPPAPRRTQTAMTPPTPRGDGAVAAAVSFFNDLQRGQVDRRTLSPDYKAFLTPALVRRASRTLAPLGEVNGAELLGLSERGGMQVASVRLTVGSRTIRTLMYRQPDGVIEQYLLW